MARYIDAIDLPIPIEEAFDYLADFSRTAEWDPGVDEARRVTPGKVRLGSRFGLTVSFLGRRTSLEYRITQFERPSRLVLIGGDSSIRSVDEITFTARPGGTRVTYEARIELVGIRRIADPIFDLLFQRVGRLAMRGLRERLAEGDSPENVCQGSSRGDRRSASRVQKPKGTVGRFESRKQKEEEGVS